VYSGPVINVKSTRTLLQMSVASPGVAMEEDDT